MDYIFVSLSTTPHSYIEISTPNVMGLGKGMFGLWLDHESEALMNELVLL